MAAPGPALTLRRWRQRFGISAPGGTVFKELGITAEAVVAAAKAL